MKGFLDEFLSPRIGITLIAETDISVNVVIDTGFTGELFIPEKIAVKMKLQIAGVQSVMLADGSTPDLQTAKVNVGWGDSEKTVLALVGGGEDVLIGVQLLKDDDVFISFTRGEVHVGWEKNG